MASEAARLKRLHRLERVRAIAKHEAALAAARAEGTLAQLEALADRTRRMVDDYQGRAQMADGLELRQMGQFVAGLIGISAATSGDADQARALANRKQEELALAERRRAAVEDRAKAAAKVIEQRRQPQALGARRAIGTALE